MSFFFYLLNFNDQIIITEGHRQQDPFYTLRLEDASLCFMFVFIVVATKHLAFKLNSNQTEREERDTRKENISNKMTKKRIGKEERRN